MSLFTDALKRTLIGAAFAFIGSYSMAAAIPAGITKVTSVEGITEYRLESNGLRILLAPDESKPTTTVNVTYRVGSRHENYGETGMAHLLEHLVFKGTPTTKNALGEFARRGLRANGSTTATLDHSNMSVLLDSDPSNDSSFIVLPRFRVRAEGDPVS
jgi:zinc protease